jgi:hypothetical protein
MQGKIRDILLKKTRLSHRKLGCVGSVARRLKVVGLYFAQGSEPSVQHHDTKHA